MDGQKTMPTLDLSALIDEAQRSLSAPNNAYQDVLTTVGSLKAAYTDLTRLRAGFNQRKVGPKEQVVAYLKGFVGGQDKRDEYLQEQVEGKARECKDLLRRVLDQARTASEVTLQLRNKQYAEAQKAISTWKRLHTAMGEREQISSQLKTEADALTERAYTGQDDGAEDQLAALESRIITYQEEIEVCMYTLADLKSVAAERKANHDAYAKQLNVLAVIRKGAGKAFNEAAQDFAEKRMFGRSGMNYDGLLKNLETALQMLDKSRTTEEEKVEMGIRMDRLDHEGKYMGALGSVDMESDIIRMEKELRQTRFNAGAYQPKIAVQ